MGTPTLLFVLALLAPAAFADEVGESARFQGVGTMRSAPVWPGSPEGVIFDTDDSDKPAAAYDTALMHGVMPDANVRLECAVPALGGLWHKWVPAEVRRFESGRFWARCSFEGVSRRPLRLRAVNAGVRAAHVFELYDAELFVRGTEAGAGARNGTAPSRVRISSGAYQFVGRDGWGAAPATQPYIEHAPNRFTMHHTAGRMPKTYDEAVEEMRFIQDFHIRGRGWIDIGYHFVISPTGHVFQGRPEGVVGAHVLNKNTGNLGISFMGNFHPPASDEPAEKNLDAFVALGRRLAADYAVGPEEILAHREQQSTDCPGDILYGKFPALKAAISGQTPPPPTAGVGVRLRPGDVDAYGGRLPW